MSFTWDASWTTDATLDGATIAASGSSQSAGISNNGKSATEVSVELTYSASGTLGATVELQRDVDGTNYEASADAPWAFSMPFAAGATMHRAITVPGTISAFRVNVINEDTAQSLTGVTVRTRQATS